MEEAVEEAPAVEVPVPFDWQPDASRANAATSRIGRSAMTRNVAMVRLARPGDQSVGVGEGVVAVAGSV